MIPELCNLPSAGVLSADAGRLSWRTRPSIRFMHVDPSGAASPQVLERDDSTEALVRMLRRQQVDAPSAAAAGAAGGSGGKAKAGTSGAGGAKREAAAGEQGGGGKRLAVSANLQAAAAAAGPSAAAAAQGPDAKGRVYTQEELKGRTINELKELLKTRGLPVSGKKETLMQRIVDYQRRQKMAATPCS